uniref:Uncharacterized protein n=1 Tax=Sinocyclocheilus grahami TaxID=75366 RepID=A0A672S4Y5_SINGR
FMYLNKNMCIYAHIYLFICVFIYLLFLQVSPSIYMFNGFYYPTKKSMLVMQEIEKEHGLGNQVGMSSNKEGYAKLREQDPKYKEHRTTFYRYHGLSNLCNLIGFFSTTVNLIYLALHLGTI